ncbi:ATPase, AAA family [Ancylostoma caninum]|uniref:ATPase, AAA family n=1 Tax=Ancylostoma caninum TaxID=29170 RepID=A0A368GE69_ANCCA|nr:ATPase, AAA family [Ancylostoma caninum]
MIPDQDKISLTSPQKCVMNGTCSHPERRGVKTFRPQVEIHLKKGVAKSQVEGRISELEAFIKDQRNIRNWIPIVVNEEPAAGDAKSLTEFIQGIVVGCMNYPDAYPLDAILDKMALCDQNVHFYKLNCDGAMSQSLSSPPGTGKTTLCRGVAQHLSIRLNSRFSTSAMVEINSHSLFSKWFSESGKLVLRMFDQIDEMAEDGKCLVFVLIDEVESLGMSRDASTSRGDPADSIRAVNALLTQIDRIRRRSNVIVLCTSNLEDCLDRALLDRADVVKHVGQPSPTALYSILARCIEELIRIGVVASDERIPSIRELKDDDALYPAGCELLELAKLAQGLSGRSIRQVPALAWSKADGDAVSLSACLSLFREAILEKAERCR